VTSTSTEGPAIVVAGDALIDLTPTTTASGRLAYEPHPGGSCLNVAVGLARLEVPTALLARVSTDGFGQLLREHLAASNVIPTYLVGTDDLTTLAAVHLRDGKATYSFHAADAADRGLLAEHLVALPDAGAIPPRAALHLGSIALVLEPVATTLEGLLHRQAGRRVISLDPNIRPGLIPDRGAYLRRFTGWVPSVHVLKVSDEDLGWLFPGRSEDDTVAGWLDAGVSLVIVTRGEGGQIPLVDGTCELAAPDAGPAPAITTPQTKIPPVLPRRQLGPDARGPPPDDAAGQSPTSEVARGGVEPPTFRFSVGRSYQLSYLAVVVLGDPDGTRTRDLRRDRAAR
jgi:fructokinase